MNILNETLATIQTELKAKKSSYNAFGKYYFRKAEDILEAVKPFLLKHQVSVRIKEDIISETPVPTIQSTAILSDGENQITATAIVGVDLNQKGMQTAQQFGAASSYGKKYALGNLFLIDDTADADSTNSGGTASKIVNKAKPKMNEDQLKKAIEYVKKLGTQDSIYAIEMKYNVSAAQMQELYAAKNQKNG